MNSRAIVLRRTAYGEADWVVTFFSRDAGQLTGFAKSARKSKRRFVGAMEPGMLVECRYAEGRGNMVRIEEARVIRSSAGILKSLGRIGAMQRAISLALAFLKEGQISPGRFDLLDRWLQITSVREPTPAEKILFELEWLSLSGFAPRTSGCVMCDFEGGGHKWFFDFDHGGLVCDKCAVKLRSERVLLSGAAVRGFKSAADSGLDADAKTEAEIAGVISRYMNHIVGRPIAECVL